MKSSWWFQIPENVDEWTASYGQWSLWYIMDFSGVRFSDRVHTGKYEYNSRTFQGLFKATLTVFKDLKLTNC